MFAKSNEARYYWPLFVIVEKMQQEKCKLECTSNSCDYMTSLQQLAAVRPILVHTPAPNKLFCPIKGNGMDKDSESESKQYIAQKVRKSLKSCISLNFQVQVLLLSFQIS